MSVAQNIAELRRGIPTNVTLIAVSKTQPNSKIQEAYDAGQRIFGENKVQELVPKFEALPKDIQWHLIGHLQSNKVKYIAPFVHLIHSIDSFKLLQEVDKQASKIDRRLNCLLQVHIAQEETKFGFSENEIIDLLQSKAFESLKNIQIEGLMGMATFTENTDQVRSEFKSLKTLFEKLRSMTLPSQFELKNLSMGMSGDYKIAIEQGSTMIRVGTALFGERNYNSEK
jgi:pyridoxal phosphate enzyme (YggS family)